MFNIKNLTKKVKNKKLKGNISLLVILVLLATSVITLLSINQIMRLISYWNQTFNYFRAYYIAKAWTELWLAEVYNREDGFNHRILSGSSIVTWNLLEDYSAFNSYFDTTITWSFKVLTNDIRESNECSWYNKITLNSGAGIMLSLYEDKTTWTKNILSSWSTTTNLNNINKLELECDYQSNNILTFAFFTYEKTNDNGITDYVMEDIIVSTWTNLTQFLSKDEVKTLIAKTDSNIKKYLTIKNSWENPISFCVKMDNNELIPYSNSLITTIWHYGDTEVWIQSIVKKWVPDWTLNVIGQPTSS